MNDYPNVARINPANCLALKIGKANRIISAVFRKYFQQHDITNSQASVLLLLSKKRNATQQLIAQQLYLEKSTVSRNINRLLLKDYIKRGAGKEIVITPNGLSFVELIIPDWEAAMAETRLKLTTQGDQALSVLVTNLIAV